MLKRFGSRATAGILSAILSLTGFAACKQDDSTIEDIYKDKCIAYINDDLIASIVITDAHGKKIKTEADIVFIIADKTEMDGKYSAIAMDTMGNLYECFVSKEYIDHFGGKIKQEFLSGISKEASIESKTFKNIPGDVYIYGLTSDNEESVIDNDNIDDMVVPLEVKEDKDSNSETITYIYPGDTFVLLEQQDYDNGETWYYVDAGKRTVDENGKTTYEIVEGYINASLIDMHYKYGNLQFVRKNKPMEIKRLAK